MISKSTIKFVKSLQQKKARKEEKLFVAEGKKVVAELLSSGWKVRTVFATKEFLESGSIGLQRGVEIVSVSESELNSMSSLSTPNQVLAVAEIPESGELNFQSGLKFMLDGINDPGNLGTIIRIADWFGIEEVICSNDTADCFNPKVVQSAMGSLFHVKIFYRDLKEVLSTNKSGKSMDVTGAVLGGSILYDEKLGENCILLIGNESNGIRKELLPFLTKSVSIPQFKGSKAESLNAAVAAGILAAELRRQSNSGN